MSDIGYLVAEARGFIAGSDPASARTTLIRDLADALETEHHRADTATATGERILADALRYRAAIETAEDFLTAHYLDTRVGDETLAILSRALKETT